MTQAEIGRTVTCQGTISSFQDPLKGYESVAKALKANTINNVDSAVNATK